MHAYALTLLAFGLMQAADAPKPDDAVRVDRDKLQGTWRLAELVVYGEKAPVSGLADYTLTVKGDTYLVRVRTATVKLQFKVDPSQNPKAIDMTYQEGRLKGKTNHAIYELDGDTLKECRHGEPERDRPTEFVSKPNSRVVLAVWKRLKP
jgi:uncharacterized protein (TIGR03067 family)